MARGRINDRTTANSTINSIGTDSEQRRREQKLEQLREQLAKERLNRLHELEKQLQTATNQQVIADLKQRRLQVEQDIADIQSALTLEIANEQYEEELTNKIKLLETARAFEKDIIRQKAVEEQLLELQKEKYVQLLWRKWTAAPSTAPFDRLRDHSGSLRGRRTREPTGTQDQGAYGDAGPGIL